MIMDLWFSVMWMIWLCHVLCGNLMMIQNCGIVVAAQTLKNIEDLKIEQKLKLINKPAIKLIKSTNGEQYECVDFYKQPGLDHPSMKNHTFNYKMRLTSYPEKSKMQRKKMNNNTFGHLWENGVGCPIGTVPILKVTKHNLLRLKSFGGDISNPRGSWNSTYQLNSPGNGHHFAVIRTKGKPKSYNGAFMNVAIYNPRVRPTQFSSARMHFQIENEFIQAGWTVNPSLFQDVTTRLLVFTNAGGHECYHSKCPPGAGMILVRQDISPGVPLVVDKSKSINIEIMKDQINGNWWLFFDGEEIGFWPSSRFIESSGTKVEWGGEVYSGSFPSPQMGNGRFPVGNPTMDSYIRLISILDGNYKRDKTVKNTERFSDNTRGYKVTDATETFFKYVGHLVDYGGPGNI